MLRKHGIEAPLRRKPVAVIGNDGDERGLCIGIAFVQPKGLRSSLFDIDGW